MDLRMDAVDIDPVQLVRQGISDSEPLQSAERAKEAERQVLADLNELAYERQKVQWITQRFDQLTLAEIWRRCQRTVAALWVDLFVQKEDLRSAFLARPQRWAPLGLVCILLSFLLYLLDVLD